MIFLQQKHWHSCCGASAPWWQLSEASAPPQTLLVMAWTLGWTLSCFHCYKQSAKWFTLKKHKHAELQKRESSCCDCNKNNYKTVHTKIPHYKCLRFICKKRKSSCNVLILENHRNLISPAEPVTHFPNCILGGFGLLVHIGGVFVGLGLQGVGVGDVHGAKGDAEHSVCASLLDIADLVLYIIECEQLNEYSPCLLWQTAPR